MVDVMVVKLVALKVSMMDVSMVVLLVELKVLLLAMKRVVRMVAKKDFQMAAKKGASTVDWMADPMVARMVVLSAS